MLQYQKQYLVSLRNEVLVTQAKAQEIATGAFDRLVQQIQQLSKLIADKDAEIKRLEELCEKNKIDAKPKPEK